MRGRLVWQWWTQLAAKGIWRHHSCESFYNLNPRARVWQYRYLSARVVLGTFPAKRVRNVYGNWLPKCGTLACGICSYAGSQLPSDAAGPVQVLLGAGADPWAVNSAGKTPLMLAADRGLATSKLQQLFINARSCPSEQAGPPFHAYLGAVPAAV